MTKPGRTSSDKETARPTTNQMSQGGKLVAMEGPFANRKLGESPTVASVAFTLGSALAIRCVRVPWKRACCPLRCLRQVQAYFENMLSVRECGRFGQPWGGMADACRAAAAASRRSSERRFSPIVGIYAETVLRAREDASLDATWPGLKTYEIVLHATSNNIVDNSQYWRAVRGCIKRVMANSCGGWFLTGKAIDMFRIGL